MSSEKISSGAIIGQSRTAQQRGVTSASKNDHQNWRLNGSSDHTINPFRSDADYRCDDYERARGGISQQTAPSQPPSRIRSGRGTTVEGWHTDSTGTDNSRDRRETPNMIGTTNRSMPSSPNRDAKALLDSNNRAPGAKTNDFIPPGHDFPSQLQRSNEKTQADLRTLLEGEGEEIIYEADCMTPDSSSHCDDLRNGHSKPNECAPKDTTPSERQKNDLIDPNHIHLRRTSSLSIRYETDELTDSSNHKPTMDESPVQTIEPTREAIPVCVFDDNVSTFVQTAKQATTIETIDTIDTPSPEVAVHSQHVETLLLGEKALTTLYNFAMEHRIFAKALLPLLAQRDQYRPDEMDTDAPIIKMGPLRKASHLVRGVWKVKYVEIRKGIFSYYEDIEHDEGQLLRKNIPLNASSLKFRPVKVNHKVKSQTSGGAIFELTEDGGPRRLWMANSKEERQAWMRAIQDAIVGGSLTRGGENNGNDNKYALKRQLQRSPFRTDLERYQKIQKEIKNATTKDMYMAALSKLSGSSLNIPVQWITEQATAADENDKAFHEDNVSSGVDQLWKDLLRDNVLINDDLFQGGSGHSPEKIIGALTRHIIGFDRSSPGHTVDHEQSRKSKNLITELQALSFARDILLSGNRTRSGGDSYFCIDTLCRHHDLVVAVPNSLVAEPWKITVTHTIQNTANGSAYSLNDRSGWLKTRSKPQRQWKRRYFVNSEGTLSYYEKAHPRPHGLRGQIKLADCHINAARLKLSHVEVDEDADESPTASFLVSIMNREGVLERQIMFEDENKFLAWAHGFERATEKKSRNASISPKEKHRFRRLAHLGLRDELVDQDIVGGGISLGDESLVDNAKFLGLDSAKVAQRMAALSSERGKSQSTVKISVEAPTDYNICTTDPQGNVVEDTWATIRATFLQSFSVCGGPNGRIVRGEELVRVKLLKCCDFHEVMKESTISPRAKELAGMVTRKLRRFGSQDVGV